MQLSSRRSILSTSVDWMHRARHPVRCVPAVIGMAFAVVCDWWCIPAGNSELEGWGARVLRAAVCIIYSLMRMGLLLPVVRAIGRSARGTWDRKVCCNIWVEQRCDRRLFGWILNRMHNPRWYRWSWLVKKVVDAGRLGVERDYRGDEILASN